MTTRDPLETLRQAQQIRTEQQLALATDVLAAYKDMEAAEQSLYEARVRYIRSFKAAARAQWKAKDLREAGFPTPKVSVLKRRMDTRRPTAPAEVAPDHSGRDEQLR